MESPDYFQFYDNNKMGIKTAAGEIVIPALYDFVALPSDGVFPVTEGGHTAYFDAEGNVMLPFSNQYMSYGNFTEGLARVMINEKWGFINKAGVEVIPPQFHYTEEFAEGRAVVRDENNLHGAIDVQGNLVIGYQYPVLTNFENGYAKFGDLNTWGLIDRGGAVVVPQIYVSIGRVYRDTVTVQVQVGEDFKEGELAIGGQVTWNNNLDHLNEFNQRKKQYIAACEQLVAELYAEGCPCEYPRFRDYIQWKSPVGFVDQELLFNEFVKQLQEIDKDNFQCPHCKTIYEQKFEQYSAFMWVLNVHLAKLGDVTDKGEPVAEYRPVALGFYGHGVEKYTEYYLQHDIPTVINYLKASLVVHAPVTDQV